MSKLRMAAAGFAIAAVGAAGVFAGVGIAGASGDENSGSTSEAAAAVSPDGARSAATATSRVQWAQVNSNGTLQRGSAGTSAASAGTGVYNVHFPRKTWNCGFSATLGQTQHQFTTGPGMIEAEGQFTSDHGVFVKTYNSAGTSTNLPFTVAILCKT